MLQEAVDNFVTSIANGEMERSGGSRNTIMAYRNDLGQLCSHIQTLGITSWPRVTHEHIGNYVRHLRDEHAYRPTTLARKLAAYKSFFRYLSQKGVVTTDPALGVCLPPVERELPQIMTTEQVQTLFQLPERDTPMGVRDLAMLHLLYATGMRVSELIALDVEHFRAQDAAMQCVGVRGNVRYLPLTSAAMDVLDRYLQHGRPHFLRDASETALFVNHHGERLTRQGFWLIIKGYARRAGIEALTPHKLRHAFAMHMINSGMDLGSVQELLGHAHISTTQFYCQLASAQHR
ncbi:tyrosine recombinase [Dictyobacter aurantiacus]|uniref:Tyrosine recombinase XerC n=1 Tax=Dictyobacter aurantiacus TaxID=1936993 RepID=A0A401ZH18_9CHLR|nr:tyrosine recombinase [Dictyobacter aurantiacus]GCE06185.1 tyrosine recombinase XerC [Dictyobacter aurantiacus]